MAWTGFGGPPLLTSFSRQSVYVERRRSPWLARRGFASYLTALKCLANSLDNDVRRLIPRDLTLRA
jgi:hypothetical protein